MSFFIPSVVDIVTTRTSKPKLDKLDDAKLLSAASYEPSNKTYEQELGRRGYSKDTSFSSDDAQVYAKDGKGFVAYRGTSRPKDIVADISIATGKQQSDKQFQSAVDTAKRVKEKYGRYDAYGHSLGGSKALFANEQVSADNVKVYNPGSTPFKQTRIDNPNVVVEKDALDIVSSGVTGNSVKKKFGWDRYLTDGILLGSHKLF